LYDLTQRRNVTVDEREWLRLLDLTIFDDWQRGYGEAKRT